MKVDARGRVTRFGRDEPRPRSGPSQTAIHPCAGQSGANVGLGKNDDRPGVSAIGVREALLHHLEVLRRHDLASRSSFMIASSSDRTRFGERLRQLRDKRRETVRSLTERPGCPSRTSTTWNEASRRRRLRSSSGWRSRYAARSRTWSACSTHTTLRWSGHAIN
jgi:hypothetical protein